MPNGTPDATTRSVCDDTCGDHAAGTHLHEPPLACRAGRRHAVLRLATMSDRGEAIRLVGTVREIVSPPSLSLLRVGSVVRRRERAGEIIVEVDREPIRASVSGDALVGDHRVTKAAWSELAAGPLGSEFPSDLAPAFAEARLDTLELAIGEEVEIYGEIVARAFAGDGAFRDAPSQRVSEVRGLIVATGSARTSRLDDAIAKRYPPAQRPAEPSWLEKRRIATAARVNDPRTKEPGHRLYRHDRSVLVQSAIALATALVLGIAALVTRSWSVSVWALAFATHVAVFRPRPPMVRFRVLQRSHRLAWTVPDWVWALGYVAYSTMLLVIPLSFGALGVLAIASATIVVVLLCGLALTPAFVLLDRLRRAPRWQGDFDTRAAIDGVVKDPTPARIGEHVVALGRAEAYDRNIGSNPDKLLWHRFHADGTFLVETERGTLEVSPQHVVWATTVTGRHDVKHGTADYEVYEIIPVEGRVLAAGWIAKTETGVATLRSKGTTPAYLVATGRHGDPRDWLARLARAHLISGVLLVALAAAATVLWLVRPGA